MADNPAGDANVTRWEYRTLTRKTEEYLVDDLNEAGADGWDLVTIEFHKDPGGTGDATCWTAFLKRSYTGPRRVALTHERIQADEIAKKRKFTTATLDDSAPEFKFQGELEPRLQPYASPFKTPAKDQGLKLPSKDQRLKLGDIDSELTLEGSGGPLKLEGDDGGLKLEGDDGGLKLEDFGELKLQADDPTPAKSELNFDDIDIIEDVEILEDEDKKPHG